MAKKANEMDFFDNLFDGFGDGGESPEEMADSLASIYYLDKTSPQDFDARLKALKFFETTNEELSGVRYFVVELEVTRGSATCRERGSGLPYECKVGDVASLSVGLNPAKKKSARLAAVREVARTAAAITGRGERDYLSSRLSLLKEDVLDEGADWRGVEFCVTTTPPNDSGWHNLIFERLG